MNITISVVRYRNSVTQGGAYVLVNGERVIEFGENIQLIKPGEKFYGENIDGYASTISDAEFIRGFCKRDEFQKYLSEAVEKEKDKVRTLKTIDPQNRGMRGMTNYERIKEMSLEEMHEFLATLFQRKATHGEILDLPCVHGLSYNDTIKVWLESEAEEKR